MCGLAGCFSINNSNFPDARGRILQSMIGVISHRGPDDSSIYEDGPIGLAHARLAVIDLSSAGRQPMSTNDGRLTICLNGEIYNFKELRAQLVREGYRFRSQTDTEVVLNGFDFWGPSVFSKLRGMFAIALWEKNFSRLTLARDRLGEKPLFYAEHAGHVLFGSEVKSILAFPGFPREENLESINHYLTFQYVPSPYCAFNGIKKIEPATYLTIDLSGGIQRHAYWNLPAPDEAKPRPAVEIQKELLSLLDESVRLRMVSDVPIGAFLSGGVDSSSVVALMCRQSTQPIKTFCVGFEESTYDERQYARQVSERYGTDHHELILKPNALNILPKLAWHYGEPFADPSALATFSLAEYARRQVTVALNGDGGDESFLGYDRYQRCHQTEWVNKHPRIFRTLASKIERRIPASLDRRRIVRIARRALLLMSERDSQRYGPSIMYFSDQDKLDGYDTRLKPYLTPSSLDLLDPYFLEARSHVGGAAWADIHTYLPDDLLVKVDIATMAHGLEARPPFLDHVFMEWAASIPVAQKMQRGVLKSLLKSAMEPYLPHEILYRKKMGFGVPIDNWLKTGLREYAYDVLLSQRAKQRGLIKADYVRRLLDEHCSGIRLHHTRIWSLLMLEMWFTTWIDPVSPPMTTPQSFSMWHERNVVDNAIEFLTTAG